MTFATDKFLLGCGVLWLIFEGWTLFNAIENDTLSERLQAGGKRYGCTTLLWGILSGHWFMPLCVPGFDPISLLLASCALLIAYRKERLWRDYMAAGLMFGLVGGRLFWPLCGS